VPVSQSCWQRGDHRNAFPGDAGRRFELDQAMADEYAEVMELKRMIVESR
jgi:hypothetical protein